MKPTINILYINKTEIPSGGGTIRMTVEYKDYTVINNPITYAGGNTEEFIVPEECVAAGDIYNYVFKITATKQAREILINFHARNDEGPSVAGMRVYQNGPTGDEDIDLGEIPMLNQVRIEGIEDMYPYTEGEYFFSTYLNTVAIGALKTVWVETDAEWMEVEFYDSATKAHKYYREDWMQWTLRINKNFAGEKREGVLNFKVRNVETDEILDEKTVTIKQFANPNPVIFNKIEVEEDSKVYVNNEGSYYFPVRVNLNMDDEAGEIHASSPVDWLNLNLRGGGTNIEDGYVSFSEDYFINLPANTAEESRMAEIYFEYHDANGQFVDEKTIWVIQEGTLNSPIKEYRSVWENIIYEVDADVFNYEVVMSTSNLNDFSDNTTIFEGRAYRYPDAETIELKLNKIFENYLKNTLIPIADRYNVEDVIKNKFDVFDTNFEALKTFYLINRDNNQVLVEYKVLYDWSYKYKWRNEEVVLSRPVDNKRAINMVNLKTKVIKNGIVVNYFSNDFEDKCAGKYALYYLNSYGGWDALLLNDAVKKTKNINSYVTEKNYRKVNIDFEQYKYINELQNTYTVNTNLLTDAQAENVVENLFTSNEIYLHDLKNNIIYSVLLTDKAIEYKKYSNNLDVIFYTINLTESQIQLKK